MFRTVSLSVMIFLLFFVLPVQSKIYDPIWMFIDNNDKLYENIRYCDTSRTFEFNCKSYWTDQLVDTGNAYNNSKYICFNYQFTSNTFYVYDEFDTELIRYKDRRPGFAGFKIDWEHGMVGFLFARYTYLIFAHQGANPGHKITIRAWFNDGTCGSPSYNEKIGTFYSSNEWKLDTILIPEFIRFKNDNDRRKDHYYELVFIINNLDPSDTSSGAPGCLKIDDIRLAGYNPIDTSPQPQVVEVGKQATFKVGITPSNNYSEKVNYQWKKNGVVIPGANSSVFTIVSVRPEDFGVYNVDVIEASTGRRYSSHDALLTVIQSSSVIEKSKTEPATGSRTVNETDAKECGCASGAGLALLPPLWFRIRSLRRKNMAAV